MDSYCGDPEGQDLSPALPGNRSYVPLSLGLSFLTYRTRELIQIVVFKLLKDNLAVKVHIPKWADGDGEHLSE